MKLWESGLIAEYLLCGYPERAAAQPPPAEGACRFSHEWRDKLVVSTIQTLGTAKATISQLQWAGVDVSGNAYLQRSSDRLPHVLGWLEDHLTDDTSGFLPGCLSLPDIFLACHIRFAENRPIGADSRAGDYPKISALLSRLDRRASFRNCPVWWWEPGVTGYENDGTPIYTQ